MRRAAAKPRTQKIRVKPDQGDRLGLRIGGWLSGRNTYLWLGVKDASASDGQRLVGTLGDRKLYRLAKAIVRHYEADR